MDPAKCVTFRLPRRQSGAPPRPGNRPPEVCASGSPSFALPLCALCEHTPRCPASRLPPSLPPPTPAPPQVGAAYRGLAAWQRDIRAAVIAWSTELTQARRGRSSLLARLAPMTALYTAGLGAVQRLTQELVRLGTPDAEHGAQQAEVARRINALCARHAPQAAGPGQTPPTFKWTALAKGRSASASFVQLQPALSQLFRYAVRAWHRLPACSMRVL